MNYTSVTKNPEGTLFIDIIDAKTKELIWQGEGSGYLTKNVDKKDERIKEFVAKILAQIHLRKNKKTSIWRFFTLII
jgi:hypothetical protein